MSPFPKSVKKYVTFRQMLEAQDPTSIALRHGEESLSFSDLLAQIDRYPLPSAQRIAIFACGTLENLIGILACVAAKRTIALLNPADDPKVLRRQVETARVECILGAPYSVVSFDSYLVEETAPSDDPEILFFTSGTTSSSKAVILNEEKLCASAFNGGSLLPLERTDTLLCVLPLSHVYGFVCSLLWGWSFGACVALGRGMRHMMDDPAFYKPTVATFVPQMAAFLSVHGLLNKELRLILIGAGDCSDEVLNGIKSKGIRVAFGYGMTETSSGVALSLGDDPRAMTVCPEFDVKLAEDGEILIHAPSTLMKGYLSEEGMVEPELEEGYFASGDLGSFDEGGRLHIIGRKKDILVLSDGTKIYCPEYEASLRNVIGNLDFAVFQDKSGKIDLAIGGTPRSEKIEDAVWRFNLSLSRGQQINKVYFVDAPLPKTATGKVRRYAIPDSIPKE